MRCALECRVDRGGVAEVIVERHVVGDVIVKLRRARLRGVAGTGDGGQRVDITSTASAASRACAEGIGDHEGNGSPT